MATSLTSLVESLGPIVAQIEGPYKWHIMAGVAILLTAFITRFVFKTFKWFLLLVLMAILVLGGFYFLIYASDLG